MVDIITSVIASVGATAFALWLARNWLLERLRQGIKFEYDNKLELHKAQLASENAGTIERLKNDLAQSAAIVALAHGSVAESHAIAHRRRIDGVALLWKALLDIRNNFPTILTILDVLEPAKYSTVLDHKQFQSLADGLSPQGVGRMATDLTKSIEEVRPFVGEYLWALFFAYQVTFLRIPLHILTERLNGGDAPWYGDLATLGLLASVVTSEEFATFTSLQYGHIAWLRRVMESKFLGASARIISGRESSDFALGEAGRIMRYASELEAKRSNKGIQETAYGGA